MKDGFSLGKIFGIEIDIDASWLVIFLLVTWNLAVGLFPQIHPEWSYLLDWSLGVLASLLFFASVLAHELAHSLVAMNRGLKVSQITLFLFGGVSNIVKESSSPKTEFLMAIVGPLTSLGLGIIFLALAGGVNNFFTTNSTASLSALTPAATLLTWLGSTNILVGLFNLIPGFPLDGGRILRSIIWGISGSLQNSTRIASSIGEFIGWFFIFAGIAMVFGVNVPILGSGIIGGIWLAFIGLFLRGAAAQSYEMLIASRNLEKVSVDKIMEKNIDMVPVHATVDDLVQNHLLGTSQQAFPVVNHGKLAGIVTLDDIKNITARNWAKQTVNQIMTPVEDLPKISPQEEASQVLQDLESQSLSQLPVVERGKVLGLISKRDILLWLQFYDSNNLS